MRHDICGFLFKKIGSVNFDDRFQPFALGNLLKARGNVFQGEAVGDPGGSVNYSLFDHANDAREMSRAVAGSEQGELAMVKEWIVDGHRGGHGTDPTVAAAESRPREALSHESGVARGIDHDIGRGVVKREEGFQ